MAKTLSTSAALLLSLGVPWCAEAGTPKDAGPDSLQAAIVKALSLIEKSTAEYRENRTCFSCHHQTLPTLTLLEAKAHGFEVDEENLRLQLKWTADHLRRNRTGYLQGRGTGGGVDTASWGLWTLQAGNWEPDAATEAVVEYLLQTAGPAGHWRGTSTRPPTQASDISRTAVIVSVLDTFGTDEQQERIAERTQKAQRWLRRVSPADTEDKVAQLRGLAYLDEDSDRLAALAADLVQDQQPDGGWAQKPGMKSDAYATSTALVALHQGGLAVSDAAWQRGVRYLLKTQLEDGSWHVVSRSRPFQTYFESGFPHGKDQFISIAASSWATSALMLAARREADAKPAAAAVHNSERRLP